MATVWTAPEIRRPMLQERAVNVKLVDRAVLIDRVRSLRPIIPREKSFEVKCGFVKLLLIDLP